MSGGTGDEEVGHLGEVDHEHFVGDGLAEGDGEFVLGLAELLGVDDALHGDDLWAGVGDFDTDGAFAGNGGDDADAEGGEAEGDVVLEVADLGDADAGGGGDLVEGDGGTDGGGDLADFYAEVAEDFDDAVLVGLEFFLGGGTA